MDGLKVVDRLKTEGITPHNMFDWSVNMLELLVLAAPFFLAMRAVAAYPRKTSERIGSTQTSSAVNCKSAGRHDCLEKSSD